MSQLDDVLVARGPPFFPVVTRDFPHTFVIKLEYLIDLGSINAPFGGTSFLTWWVRDRLEADRNQGTKTYLCSLFILALEVVCSTVRTFVSRHLASIAYLTASGTVAKFRKGREIVHRTGKDWEEGQLSTTR